MPDEPQIPPTSGDVPPAIEPGFLEGIEALPRKSLEKAWTKFGPAAESPIHQIEEKTVGISMASVMNNAAAVLSTRGVIWHARNFAKEGFNHFVEADTGTMVMKLSSGAHTKLALRIVGTLGSHVRETNPGKYDQMQNQATRLAMARDYFVNVVTDLKAGNIEHVLLTEAIPDEERFERIILELKSRELTIGEHLKNEMHTYNIESNEQLADLIEQSKMAMHVSKKDKAFVKIQPDRLRALANWHRDQITADRIIVEVMENLGFRVEVPDVRIASILIIAQLPTITQPGLTEQQQAALPRLWQQLDQYFAVVARGADLLYEMGDGMRGIANGQDAMQKIIIKIDATVKQLADKGQALLDRISSESKVSN